LREDKGQEKELQIREKRSIATQTLFRESEAQTDPTGYIGKIERDGSFLEILELKEFSFGKGLPASMYEIELITKMREKRAFNDALPPLSDESCFQLRRKITQQQEVREWAFTEKEFKEANNQRLIKLQQLLEENEKNSEEIRIKKIDELKNFKEEEVEAFIIKTRKLRVKIIRQTGKQKENFNKKEKFKRDIIMEYASFGSKVYAPLTRDGSNPDRNSFKFEMHSDYLNDIHGLNYLEMNLENKGVLNTNSSTDHIDKIVNNKSERVHIKALDFTFESIKKAEQKKEFDRLKEIERNKEKLNKIDKGKVIEKKADDVNYIEEIMLIQRLLKGRKEQNLMYQGKLKRAELIKELRDADYYKSISNNNNEEDVNKNDNYLDKLTNGLIDAIQGHTVSQNLDYLSKEMKRSNQEKLINTIVNKAEDERRKREAEEMGKRQAENLIRSRQDIMYKDLLDTNQSTMDSYINSLFSSNVNKVSKKQVMREIEIKAKKLNTIVDKIEGMFIKDDITVKDLVSSFIIPEIGRKKVEDKIESEEKRFIEKTKDCIQISTQTAARELFTIKEAKDE
jgi:hypothetical protein